MQRRQRDPGVRDYLWAGAAIWFGIGYALTLVRMLANDSPIAARFGGAALLGLFAFWVTMGCWNRSVWGARGKLVDDVKAYPGSES